jgi:hypothetical protein
MGNAQSEQKENLQSGQIVKFNVFNETNVRECLKSLINFKNKDRGIYLIDKFITSKSSSNEDVRKQFYQEFLNNLNDMDTNKVKLIGKKIAEGSFGKIYDYYQGRYVLKFPKADPFDPLEAESSFLIEVLANIVYQCYKNNIIQLIPYPIGFKWPFPQITQCSKTNSNIAIIMSKLEITALDLILNNQKNPDLFNIVMDILIQVCIYIYGLQIAIGFIHRDFHSNNAMLTMRPKPVLLQSRINNKEISFNSSYELFIIDLGQSCAQISNCSDNKCDTILLEAPAASYNVNPIEGCFNRSHDIRLFCGSLSYFYLTNMYGSAVNNLSSANMDKVKKTYIKNKTDALMFDLYIKAFQGISQQDIDSKATPWHALYPLLTKPVTRSIFDPPSFFTYLSDVMNNNP